MSAFDPLRTFAHAGSIDRMEIIHLDASGWQSADDFYRALLLQLGAPAWHGHNLDALHDSLRGGINRVEAPFTVEIRGVQQLSSELVSLLAKVATVFEDAREKFDTDVSLKVS